MLLVLLLVRGEDFRQVFKQLGELRAIVPANINMLALTATATKRLRTEICCTLGIKNPVAVEVSPDKPNVRLACNEFTSISETLGPIAERLKIERTNLGRVIIFCKRRLLCSQIYSFFKYVLGLDFTEPPMTRIESPTVPENHLVDMFTSGTHPCVKEVILKSFKSSTAPLRIVIATIAFGLGIDCTDVREVIHLGPPSNIEEYVQHIGRAGRDNKPSCALLLYGPGLMGNTTKSLVEYCKRNDLCRRNFLFTDFECYKPNTVKGCHCCDVCSKCCVCSECKDTL